MGSEAGSEASGAKDWYASGLRFECTRCGACCRTHGEYAYVYLDDAEVDRIADHLGLTPDELVRRHCRQHDGWTYLAIEEPACPFLGADSRCTIYPVRPKQCATWPFWRENLERETWEGPVRSICPGIGTGRLYDPDEIDRIAARNEPESSP